MLLEWMSEACWPVLPEWMPNSIHLHSRKWKAWHKWVDQWCHLCFPEMWRYYCNCHCVCFLVVFCPVFPSLRLSEHIVGACFLPLGWNCDMIGWMKLFGSVWLVPASDLWVESNMWHIWARAYNYWCSEVLWVPLVPLVCWLTTLSGQVVWARNKPCGLGGCLFPQKNVSFPDYRL